MELSKLSATYTDTYTATAVATYAVTHAATADATYAATFTRISFAAPETGFRNRSTNSASRFFASTMCSCFTCPNPRMNSGIEAMSTATS